MKAILALLLLANFAVTAQTERFYVGGHTDGSPSQGIFLGTLDAATGKLGPIKLAAAALNPNFFALAPGERVLYAVTSANRGSVSSFKAEQDGSLTLLNDFPSGNGCHVAVDATGRNVFMADYGEGSISSFRAQTNGALEKRVSLFRFTGSGPDKERQTHPYAHSTYTDAGNHHLYACDLGSDRIWIFDLDAATGTLTPASLPSASVSSGSGPRHLAFSLDQSFAYVNGEMGLNVTAFARDPKTGALASLELYSTLPPYAPRDGMTTAEVFCHPSGKWLYVSNRDVAGRGRDSIAVFAIGTDGKLMWLQNAPAGVKVPRSFNIDLTGRWMIVAGQDDNQIVVLKIDATTGKLSLTDEHASVPSPQCVLFAK